MSHGQIDQLQSGREANPSILQIGDKIGNHYEIYDILGGEGKSGMGIIYVCYDHDNKGVFALKTLQDRYRTSEETNKQFEREALVWIELERHPYIVRAWWVEKIEGRLFVTLEYIAPDERGRNTLTHYLRDLSLTDILKISIQFCHGMEYAHSRGINAHRDIKPDNIMITYNSTVKITDFGLSKAFQEIDIECDTISEFVQAGLSIFKSKSNKICGTLPYMAPEQFDGFADYRSDVYSFGIVLFQMANKGELPYVGKNPEEFEQLHKFAPTPYFFSPLFPIINKCLQKATSCRYKTFTLLREDLEKLLLSESGESIAIPAEKDLELWEILNKGTALHKLGKNQAALTCYDSVLKSAPKYANALFNKGIVLGELKKYDESLKCYEETLKYDKEHFLAWCNMGNILLKNAKYHNAIICFDAAININPNYSKAWRDKGTAYSFLGKHYEAIGYYDRSIELDDKDPDSWFNKGNDLRSLERFDEAIICYDEVIKIEPNREDTWINKGIALKNLEKHREAIICYDEALKIDPQAADALNYKGNSLASLGKYQEAIICFDKALNIDSRETNFWLNKGVVLYTLGKHEESIICYNEILKINPNDATSWYNKGVALNCLGKIQEAHECFEIVMSINPKLIIDSIYHNNP